VALSRTCRIDIDFHLFSSDDSKEFNIVIISTHFEVTRQSIDKMDKLNVVGQLKYKRKMSGKTTSRIGDPASPLSPDGIIPEIPDDIVPNELILMNLI